jgi:NTE family protein
MAVPPLRLVTGRRSRLGLVLGGGGVLGAAWMAGALAALQERIDRPLGDADLIVGTSAGSVLAAALRCGFDAGQIVEHQRGSLVALPGLSQLDRDSGPRPPLPRLRIGSPRLLASTAMSPLRVRPWVAASGLVPRGRGQLHYLGALVDAMLAGDGGAAAGALQGWPGHGETWIVAVDYRTGRRIAFGRDGAPAASLADAVVASCSIPGWYEPKTIDGRPYVDGGVCSSTSLDLAARVDLDEVYVLAPMASYLMDRPWHPGAQLERMLRRVVTIGLGRELRKVEATGARITLLTPGPEDLAAMGANLMNPGPRLRVLDTSLRTSAAALDGRSGRPGTEQVAA